MELGVIPLRFHLMARRICYFQAVMQRDDGEITKKIVICQKEDNHPGDFYPQVANDMEKLQISEFDVINISHSALKSRIDKSIAKAALEHLLHLAKSHSKTREKLYTNLDGMEYFRDSRFTSMDANILFKFRTRMFNVKNNFRNNYRQSDTLCPLCKMNEDSQEHLFQCEKIKEVVANTATKYEDIFSKELDLSLIHI